MRDDSAAVRAMRAQSVSSLVLMPDVVLLVSEASSSSSSSSSLSKSNRQLRADKESLRSHSSGSSSGTGSGSRYKDKVHQEGDVLMSRHHHHQQQQPQQQEQESVPHVFTVIAWIIDDDEALFLALSSGDSNHSCNEYLSTHRL